MDENKFIVEFIHLYDNMVEDLGKIADSMNSLKEYVATHPYDLNGIDKKLDSEIGCLEYQICKTKDDTQKAKDIVYEMRKEIILGCLLNHYDENKSS